MDSNDSKSAPAFTAVKTEPYGQTFLVPTAEVPEYEALVQSVFRQYQPHTFMEKMVTQSVVNYQWRLRRADQLEKGLYAYGRHELAPTYAHIEDAQARAELVDAAVAAKLQRELKNVAQQRRHLTRMLKSETAHLHQILKENPKKRGLFLVPKREKK